ncbi:MAG: GNAT family N-acetyltransferase [Cyanobacteria bacterium J06635_15]
MQANYRDFLIRSWHPSDRELAARVVAQVLQEYGLAWEPTGSDRDVVEVEACYWAIGGEFWVIEEAGQLIGTAGYQPIKRGNNAVEIRKMYLMPSARGQGLGKFLLGKLEEAIATRGYQQIWIETASVLQQAVQLYETQGYQSTTGVETIRCDRVYIKILSSSLSSL